MNIEIFNETEEDIKELASLKKFLMDVSKDEDLDNIIFNVVIVNSKETRELNREYRNIDSETDVLSFALEDDSTFNNKEIRVLGDIYISIDKAKSQAIEYEHSFKRELFFLALHGFLHLLGYDHLVKEDEETMFKKQEEILNRYKINR